MDDKKEDEYEDDYDDVEYSDEEDVS